MDSAHVIARLEEAGATLLALPQGGYSPRLRAQQLDVVHTAVRACGWQGGKLRPPIPSAARITRMDEALGWITHIPQDRYVLRRIVGARSLVSPVTERHLYSWRRLGELLGADHKAVQRWHGQGVDMIVNALSAQAAANRRLHDAREISRPAPAGSRRNPDDSSSAGVLAQPGAVGPGAT